MANSYFEAHIFPTSASALSLTFFVPLWTISLSGGASAREASDARGKSSENLVQCPLL